MRATIKAFCNSAKGRVIFIFLTCLVLSSSLLFLTSYRQFIPSLLHDQNRGPEYASQLSSQQSIDSGSVDDKRYVEQLLHPQDHSFREPTVIHYHWVITSGSRSPDGVEKRVYLINDAFPGPTIEARSGDTLVVEVVNNLGNDDGISIHWHGVHMTGANEMDGAVGFTQCPIPPGSNFTYTFRIDDEQAGTFWYHSHAREQIGDGLYGGLVVHKPANIENEKLLYGYDDELLLLVGDWYHHPADELFKKYLHWSSAGAEPVPDSLVINGIGRFNCSMASGKYILPCVQEHKQPSLRAHKEKKYRIRFVNVGSLSGLAISIPKSKVEAVQVDGGYKIKGDPNAESIGIIYPGERIDAIIEWGDYGSDDEPKLLVIIDEENSLKKNLALTTSQSFPISLSMVETHSRRSPRKQKPKPHGYFDLSTLSGLEDISATVPAQPDHIFVIYTSIIISSINKNMPEGVINRTSWKEQANPSLPLLALERDQWDKNQLVPWTGSNEPSWVDIVVNNNDYTGHPFHLHGFDFFVVSTCSIMYGPRYSPFSSTPPRCGPYNLVDPPRKDTVYIPAKGYVVLRFRADNEGIWLFHCHILWHHAGGMAMAFQVMGSDTGVFGQDVARREVSTSFCNTSREIM